MKKLSNNEMTQHEGGQTGSMMACVAEMWGFGVESFEYSVYLCALAEHYSVH